MVEALSPNILVQCHSLPSRGTSLHNTLSTCLRFGQLQSNFRQEVSTCVKWGTRSLKGKEQLWRENVAAHCKVMGHSTLSYGKTAEPLDMPFWVKTRVGPRNHVLNGGGDPPTGRGNFWGLSGPFKSISNLRCIRRCRVRCKRDHSIANKVIQQASGNRNPENSKRRRCDLSAEKGVMGVHSAGKPDIYDRLVISGTYEVVPT